MTLNHALQQLQYTRLRIIELDSKNAIICPTVQSKDHICYSDTLLQYYLPLGLETKDGSLKEDDYSRLQVHSTQNLWNRR